MGTQRELAKRVIAFVKRQKTQFSLYGDLKSSLESGMITFETRENGDVGAEEYSEIDMKEGERLEKLIMEEFSLDTEVEPCDEWVHLEVSLVVDMNMKPLLFIPEETNELN